jgi:FkbM family methyltransferase
MNRQTKQLVKRILGKRLFSAAVRIDTIVADRRGSRSYSQEGEDRVLASLLLKIHGMPTLDGFYVDVGAHHPYRYSNTCFFYKRGWRGINIDAMPGSMAEFRKQRPRDINVESGIGRQAGTSKLYVFNVPALNTFDEDLARARCNDVWRVIRTVDVPIAPLSEILKQHLPNERTIDFLTVDVEGSDLDVLQSNDWNRYRPSVVLAETLGRSLDDLALDPVTGYMRSLGYVAYAKTVNTTFFVDGIFTQQLDVPFSEKSAG